MNRENQHRPEGQGTDQQTLKISNLKRREIGNGRPVFSVASIGQQTAAGHVSGADRFQRANTRTFFKVLPYSNARTVCCRQRPTFVATSLFLLIIFRISFSTAVRVQR